MKTLYIECAMGAAGDMLTAALLELMPDKEAALAKLNAMGIPGVAFEAEPSAKCGITGTHIMARRKVLCHVGIRMSITMTMRMSTTTNMNMTMYMSTTTNMTITCIHMRMRRKMRIVMTATRTTTHTITSMMRITRRIMAWQRSAV